MAPNSACPAWADGVHNVAELLDIATDTPYTADVAERVADYLREHWATFGAARGAPALILWYTDPGRTTGSFRAGDVPFCLKRDGTPAPGEPRDNALLGPILGATDGIAGAIAQGVAAIADMAVHGMVLAAILAVLLLGLWYLFRDAGAPGAAASVARRVIP